jgi:hypothetical protein
MKKGEVFAALLVIILVIIGLVAFIPFVYSESIDIPVKELTYHAEQYETGNINYAQLLIYISTLKKDIANAMGGSSIDKDIMLSGDQLESALGKPTDSTKWVWVENRDEGGGYEKKLEKQIPSWRKIIFDGKKIQILLNAWPQMRVIDSEEKLFYNLNMETRFKSAEDKIDLQSKIDEIKLLGEKYSTDHSSSSLDELAKNTVVIEQSFQKYYSMNAEKCVDLMNGLFGGENKKPTQKILHNEIDFASGKDFDVYINLDMCDECEYNWININTNIQTRIYNNNQEEYNMDDMAKKYLSYTNEEFKTEIKNLLDGIKQDAINGNIDPIYKKSQELSIITKSWDENSNKLLNQQKDPFKTDFDKMTQEERDQCSKDFCWIKKEQKRRENERTLRNQNYQERKQFYLSLFNDLEKKESYYEEEQWEKRILEKFREAGEEKCDNNIDDNKNSQIDCADDQCSGKKCGYNVITIFDENESKEQNVELFCMSGTCQQKADLSYQSIENNTICGNHICEENENLTCIEDCGSCPVYDAINCSGQAIFSGKDENGCLLAPICMDENTTCSSDSDCIDPLCGKSSCIETRCQITQLNECKEAQCSDGDEKVEKCNEGEIVKDKCIEGTWITTGLECKSSGNEIINNSETEEYNNSEQKNNEENKIVGFECSVKGDCGNENDVCSNGKCITLPSTTESIEITEVEINIPETSIENKDVVPEETSKEEISQGENKIVGEVILNIFKSITNNILTLTGYVVDDTTQQESTSNTETDNTQTQTDTNQQTNEGENQQTIDQNNVENSNSNQNNNEDQQRQEQDRERKNEERHEEDKQRREKECNDMCTRQCNDNLIRPCVEDCIWKKCGNDLKCNIDETKGVCQTQCETEKDISSCQKDCNGKCIEGKDTRMEPDNKNQKQPETFVLSMVGTCRKATGKEETMLWFNVWGDEIKDLQSYKMKYYNKDNNDWCKQDLENLIKQRKELENSLNDKFAEWFFEKYVVNTDAEWEKHISGIFDLYWMDIEISKQMADRMRCLGIKTLPEYNLINFTYKTQFGSIEFWEEINNNAKIFDDSDGVQVISPFMKTWLFPTKDFYKYQMKKSMENHNLIGPDSETTNTLPQEMIEKLKNDNNFMNMIRKFNDKGYSNLALQLKDYDTNEIIYNVLIKINDKDLMYFKPMPVSELPPNYVVATLDVNKLIEMIEFEQKGRVELQSPPWDNRPKEKFVKGVVDNVKMYMKFQGFLNSLQVSEKSVKSESKFFVENFFKIVVNGDKGGDDKQKQEPKEKENQKNNNNKK